MKLTRRNACLSLAFLSRITAWGSQLPRLRSKAYRFEDLPIEQEKHVAYRAILEGRSHTGDYLEAHETVLQPGAAPHPSHHHVGEELFLISSTASPYLSVSPMRSIASALMLESVIWASARIANLPIRVFS